MKTPRTLSTNDVILLRSGAHDTRSWQRTLDQIRNADDALADLQKPTPFDWEAENVF